MFDAPIEERLRLAWQGNLDIDSDDWNIGLIYGPSGSGKTTIARHMFGAPAQLTYADNAVIDDFASTLTVTDIAEACQAVGFNTIPAWFRPFSVLSTGEQFRVDIARRLLELPDPIVIDEFTSVVDRQVAQIACHAVQKFVRRNSRKLIAVSCHSDIIDWLQPDWTFEVGSMHFARRSLQPRPSLEVGIKRVPYNSWHMFSKFHYMTADLHRGARCFALYVGNQIASFGATLHRVNPRVKDITGLSRLVTLPDWQGLGLAMILSDKLGSAYAAIGRRFHTYPAHPSLVRSYNNSKHYKLEKRPGVYLEVADSKSRDVGKHGGRPCAVFSYCGPAMDKQTAENLLN